MSEAGQCPLESDGLGLSTGSPTSINWMTLGQLYELLVPRFPHVQRKEHDSYYLVEWLQGLNELIFKLLGTQQALNKCFIPTIILVWKVSIVSESEVGVSEPPRLQGEKFQRLHCSVDL